MSLQSAFQSKSSARRPRRIPTIQHSAQCSYFSSNQQRARPFARQLNSSRLRGEPCGDSRFDPDSSQKGGGIVALFANVCDLHPVVVGLLSAEKWQRFLYLRDSLRRSPGKHRQTLLPFPSASPLCCSATQLLNDDRHKREAPVRHPSRRNYIVLPTPKVLS